MHLEALFPAEPRSQASSLPHVLLVPTSTPPSWPHRLGPRDQSLCSQIVPHCLFRNADTKRLGVCNPEEDGHTTRSGCLHLVMILGTAVYTWRGWPCQPLTC